MYCDRTRLAHEGLLNRVEEIRLVADYKGDAVEPEQAQWAVQQAVNFVETIQLLITA